MKSILKKIFQAATVLLACSMAPAHAEDIDLFLGSSGSGANILFVLDNSSNWAAANQNWPTDTEQPMAGWCGNDCGKQGYYELKALYKLIAGTKEVDGVTVFLLPEGLSVGLMMFNNSTATRDGGYIRAAVLPLGSGSGSHREFLKSTIELAIRNFNTETAASSVQYAAGLFDAYKYFGGYSNPKKTFPGNPAISSPTYQTVPVFGTAFWGDNDDDGNKVDMRAYDGANYKPVIDATNNCGKNYIIFIGNGFPAKDDVASSDMSEVLRKLNDPRSASPAAVAQLDMPAYTETPVAAYSCKSSTACVNTDLPAAQAAFSASKTQPYCQSETYPSGVLNCNFAVSFSCAKSTCNGQNLRVVASGSPSGGGVVQPTNNDLRYGDEFAQFIASSDVSAQSGEQTVSIFPIDVFRAQPDARQTQLMRSIASYGNGEYYSASDYEQLKNALEDIVRKINAVNSVFASASLPVSATNRAQNENQVFIGLFRPDSQLRPSWPGNLKRYQIVEISDKLVLGDRYKRNAINTLTGFIDDCAVSYWTADKGPYWNGIVSDVSTSTACTLRPLEGNSTYDVKADFPDGPSVEKGAVSQVIRLGNDPGASQPTYSPVGRKLFTLDSSNVVAAIATVVPSPDDTQKFAAGYDVTNQRPGGDSTTGSLSTSDVRPSVHGDVIHSRPLPITFTTPACTNSDPTTCPEPNVAMFYGSNDGMLRAVDAKTGKEIWSFISRDEYQVSSARLLRLKDNAPMVLYPQVSYLAGENPRPKDYFFDGSSTAYQGLDSLGKDDVRLFTGMRRGGRYVYAFDVSKTLDATEANRVPALLWKFGCSASGACTSSEAADIGQTWSTPIVVKVKTSPTPPAVDPGEKLVVAFGGGYDGGYDTATSSYRCDDQDSVNPSGCDTNPKGRSVYILDAGPRTGGNGAVLKKLPLPSDGGAVAADVAFVDVDYDGYVDYGYAVDMRGNIYRITLRAADGSPLVTDAGDWSAVRIDKIAYTNVPDANAIKAGRKFLFAPSVLAVGSRVYIAVGSGDRERPLRSNYPYQQQVKNRFYVFLDDLDNRAVTGNPNTPVAYDLDGASMYDASLTNGNADCTVNRVVPGQTSKMGWYLDLAGQDTDSVPPLWDGDVHRGEQVVTSALIAAGVVYFSTNSPDSGSEFQCTNNLGIARGYALNLLNGSGALGSSSLVCGGNNYGEFVGGGLPPSPVLGRVVYKYTTDASGNKNPVVGTICIGCIAPGSAKNTVINPVSIKPPISPKRNKIYWYNNTDKRTK